MKKLLSIAAFAAITLTSKAQVYIQGGLNFANITADATGNIEKNNMLTTYNAGLLGRFDLSKSIDVETGIILTGKGSHAETYFSVATSDYYLDNYIKTKFNPLYLEVPLNLVLKFPFQKSMNFFIHGGPYVAVGIAGKATTESKFSGITSSSTNNIAFNNDDPFTSGQEDAGYNKLKRFDLGMNVGGGLDLGKVILKANYGMGFTKINSTETNNSADEKNKYRVISFSVGIPLGR